MNIYVGNLAEEVNDDDLRAVFEAFGQVESINILRDRFSGESKGFGFVEMPSKDEAQKAAAANGAVPAAAAVGGAVPAAVATAAEAVISIRL